MMDWFKIFNLDVRLLGTIAAAMFALAALLQPEPARNLAPSQLGRGTLGAQIISIAWSPTGKQMATTDTEGHVALRVQKSGWQIERFLDFPGYARDVAFSPDGRFLAVVGYGHRHLPLGTDVLHVRANRVHRSSDRA